ncbi:hypothetical protein L1987_65967 [Smallanthus sonchifolius]|uniref:Uncharacterized protein n=1 Tax=Smallanthus sonchifolius TaxID=185202 RepID=A0ACB9BVZ3_9ASTR|nr:hypothetical protein L1987_65967 [Smallanthus sonchifolius]
MGRGVSCGGGQSSLGYLFCSGEETGDNTRPPPENPSDDAAATTEPPPDSSEPCDTNTGTETDEASEKPTESFSVINQNPNSTTHDSTTNNYHRADGQNCGNFITDRPSTKVHAAPGGNSSLGYLFGDDKK